MQVQNKKDILLKLKKHRAILKNFGVEQIGLFGSFVKNRQKENSDVDLLVKFDKSKKTFRNFIQFAIPKRNEIANGITIRTLHLLKIFRKLSYDWYTYVESLWGRNVEVLTPESMSPYIAPYIKEETEYVKITR